MQSQNGVVINVIGGGLAGSEAAWQLAERGFQVKLYEMRPEIKTGAHESGDLAELVCSNSLGSNLPNRASGLLKNELRQLGSLLIKIADRHALPAGAALAVDRESFAKDVTATLSQHANIRIIRQEITTLPTNPTIIASGPLTSLALSKKLAELSGRENLFFFDAIAPIIYRDSIDMEIAFRASRYNQGDQDSGDYLNCPLSREEYFNFIEELVNAERIQLKEFEDPINKGVQAGAANYFEGCLPVEVLAARNNQALAYGPLRPVGLRDIRTNKRAYAVLQLRQDNLAGDLYNMVGFQTNLTFAEQRRLFRSIPGLANAEFARFGQMHRNTFICSPVLLNPTLQLRQDPRYFFAGQITGVEGYAGNIATGLFAALNLARNYAQKEMIILPTTTMLGALIHYITHADLKDFQPMKANYGILPPLDQKIKTKNERYQVYSDRAKQALTDYLIKMGEITE